MRTLMIHSRLDLRGGAENLVLFLARGLQRRGHAVSVATRRYNPTLWAEREWDGIPIHLVDQHARFIRTRWRKARLRSRAVASLSDDADLVVAHNFPSSVWATHGWRRGRRPRVIWYCHEPVARVHWRQTQPTLVAAAKSRGQYPWLEDSARKHVARLSSRPRRRIAIDRRLDRNAVSRVDAILANSSFTAQTVAYTYGRDAVPCHPGIPSPAPLERGRPGRAHVAWVTSPQPHKNAIGFLEAIRIAVRERGARDLLVRAVGIQMPEFQEIVRQKGIGASVVLEPRLTGAELEQLIATSHLTVYPSIDEPFGLVLVEAMAHGRPVVASELGGPREVVVPGVTGLLVDPLDPGAMANAVLELWGDAERADRLGAAGRQRFAESFTVEKFVDRFEECAFQPTPCSGP
jgi:glycosyltransferase involved in cell wall biosynthesis